MERKKLNKSHQDDEILYKSLFNLTTEGITVNEIIYDNSGRAVDYKIIAVNPAFEKISGMQKQKVVRKRASKIYGDGKIPNLDIYAKVVSSGKPALFEIYYPETAKRLAVSVFPLVKGKFVTVFSEITNLKRRKKIIPLVHKDQEVTVAEHSRELTDLINTLKLEVHERKQAQTLVEVQNKQFNELLDMLPVYIVLLTSDYHVSFANRFFRERFGESRGKRCFEYLFGRNKPCESCKTYGVLKNNAPLQWDWVGPDGRNYSIYDFPFKQTDGSTMILEVGIDITEEKRVQKALQKAQDSLEARVQKRTRELRETRDYLDNLINYANAPIIVWNPEYEITRFNRAFERLTRLNAAEVVGRKLDILFPQSSRESSTALIQKLVTGARWEVVEIPILRADGTVRTVLWNSANIYGTDGITLEATIAQGQDITDLKETQEKLLAYERLATIGKVSGSIAHEIRNPLAVIDSSIFYIDKILQEADERVKIHLNRITAATRRCASVIEALLKLTNPDELRIGSVDLKEFLDTVLAEYCPAGITTVRDFISDPITIRGDQEQLRIAFGNIIQNAVQAMGGKGTLTAATYIKADTLEVSIEDTGPGIIPENMEKIFQPLFSTKAKGVGLGLSIAKSIVDLHHGSITVASEPGKGATFTISFPLILPVVHNHNVKSL